MHYLAFLDDGHGSETFGKRTPYIKELGRQIRENEFNSAVVDLIAAKLKPMGIVPILVAPGDSDRPLKERTNFANKTFQEYKNRYGSNKVKAVYVSVHYDALSNVWSTAEGITVFVYNGQKNKDSGKLANDVGNYLKQGTKQKYRGVKEGNFHVLRETSMPAILTENGFMSSAWESLLMVNKDFQNEVATEHVKGISKYFGLSFKDSGTLATPSQKTSTPKPSESSSSKPSGNSNIKAFQTWLNQNYNTKLSTDGLYGSNTKKGAVKALQTELNKQTNAKLGVDGIFGNNTKNACITVRKGATGNITRIIQGELYCHDYNPNGFDGDFGNGCDSAVRYFQRKEGLASDGIVGQNTFEKLLK